MAPKAKAKAKAKGVAKAKAKPFARPRAMRALVRGLRRPAAPGVRGDALTIEERWRRGDEVEAEKLHPGELKDGLLVAIPAASYFLQECRVSGKVQGVEMKGGETHCHLLLMGTTSENLLKLHTANPSALFKVHLCTAGCNQQEVADQLIHAKKFRQVLNVDAEDGWVTNLEKVRPLEEGDDLEALRARGQALKHPGLGDEQDLEKDKKKEKKMKKEKKKKKSKKEEKAEKEEESSTESGGIRLNGTMARQACRKKPKELFSGTGLDPTERVRQRVARRARRAMKRKGKKDSSSSGSSSSKSSRRSSERGEEETVFQQASKVKLVATGFPGTLACQALCQMRSVLLSEIGNEDRPGVLKACALAYFRQQLSRKANGPAHRELLNTATAIDLILSGNAAGALDVLIQRFKSCESTLAGCHWTVAQRLELSAPEGVLLTPGEEMVHARRDIYQESRLKWLSSQPEGRPQGGTSKGGGKNKGEGKDGIKGKDRRWNKGGAPKGDATRKKEEASK